MTGQLQGRVAVVTGAGSGIGRATSLMLAQEGARVVVTDRNAATAEATARDIGRAGGEAAFLTVDVTDRVAVRAMVDLAMARFGALDIAVNNAGLTLALATVGDMPDADWDHSVAVNLTGVRNCMHEELRVMGPGGSIVNIASGAGLRGLGLIAPYVASKHGLLGLTKSAAIEYGPRAIRVNAICPGFIDTPIHFTRPDATVDMDAIGKNYPMRRVGRPEEIADAVIWLASDRSSYVTGIALPVDGGFSAI